MNLENYTFGQLWRLSQPETLMEVVEKYHTFLEQEVPDARENGIFSYALAEASLDPSTTVCWRQKIAFLTGGELKVALRKAAQEQAISPTPGHAHFFVGLNRFKFPNYQARVALSGLILMHCRHNGVPASCEVDAQEKFKISTECGSLGQSLLRYKPGLKWGTIQKFCLDMNVPVWLPFPWVPLTLDDAARINPCTWPANTPDVNETVKEILSR